ncbi:MAG: helix-turn-helix domain-containing protein [Gemmataceae bacterium]|nr:helix-turn-helix domain-containing protein [Gemmataceae bacterium]
MSLGAELRKERQAAGLTQERLAFAAGLDRAYISQLENDHKSPTVDVLYLICDALAVAASDLLARVERTRQPRRKAGADELSSAD